MTQRKFDPEALEEFMRVVREDLLKTLEDELEPLMQEGGSLNKEPAFGQLEGSNTARQAYSTFHSGTWTNLESIRAAYYGMLKTLQDSIDLHEEGESMNVSETTSYENELS
ncbi:hypothetical protein [Glycomyces arizonensis]|uniref:hypothetical protein n=1 Tax=Glycomyces arizonensis TaxID=256035 RepID=UPI00040D9071|nr:hypothetical protein [Glycomyces arizonensis]